MQYSKLLKLAKNSFLVTCLVLISNQFAQAQPAAPVQKVTSSKVEQEVINLSKQKWQWMSDRNLEALTSLFHEKAIFVHMGGTMSKQQELDVIKSGGIHYKKADIHQVSVNVIGNTAICLNNITLLAVVGGNEVTNPFAVTEVYVKDGAGWKIASLSFTKLLTQ